MADPRPLTRNQIAKFVGNDPEAIRAIERLFRVAGQLTPTDVVELRQLIFDGKIDLGTVDNKAEVGLAIAQESVELARLGATAPATVQDSRVDYLDFNAQVPHVSAERRVAWNDFDRTLDIGMAYGVVQQVGLETYARVQNSTGLEMPNGTVVGFAGVGDGNSLSVTPYQADGSQPTLYILGVLTHDLPDTGEIGYCATWGHVRGLDTTGSAFGEAWAVGDILYASPSVAGGFTNVKPTAPQNVVPIAAVLSVGAVQGEIFVRPTIAQQLHYGTFSRTTDYSPAAALTAYPIEMDSSRVASGISIGSPASRIIAAHSGLYDISVTLQYSSSNSSSKDIYTWIRKNGVDVERSSRIVSLSGSGTFNPVLISEIVSLAAGDYIEIVFASTHTNISLNAVAATAFAPGSPAINLVVTQVQQ
jgi:hypothetical protein